MQDNLNNKDLYILELHKENSTLLNKLLACICPLGVGLMAYTVGNLEYSFCFAFLALSAFSFGIIVLLYSFFQSEEAINLLSEEKIDDAKIKNEFIKKLNKTVFYCVVFGVVSMLLTFGSKVI